MPETRTARNIEELREIFVTAKGELEKHGYLSVAFSPYSMQVEDFTLSSLPQKALKAIWIRKAASHAYQRDEKNLEDQQIEGMNRYMKLLCYQSTKQKYLLRHIEHPETHEVKLEVTSSAKWDKGEMKFFLDWMQAYWAERGLILEAKGEYAELSKYMET